MKLCTSGQIREIDRHVISDMGVPGADLMSNAAAFIAATTLEHISMGGCAAAVCGTGNNGGDGIGAAAYLIEKGVPTRVFLIGVETQLTLDSVAMLERLTALGGYTEPFIASDEQKEYFEKCDVIIDAMFGVGLNSELRGGALGAAGMINASNACVIAADIPSGVHADTGAILGDAVKADITVTFSMAKRGHFIEPGCTCCGELLIRDIGIPGEIIDDAETQVFAVTRDDIWLPRRRPDSHKGDYGRCLIVAGSVGYTGAPAMCARAATRMGAGLVYLGAPESVYSILAAKLDEEMPFPLPNDENGKLASNAGGELLRRAEECDVCVIGPGLGRSPEITELVRSMLRIIDKPIVLDADGLNAIADNIDILGKAISPLVLTPHSVEFQRLGGDLSSGDRLGAARAFARMHGCVLVLKGHRTITAFPDGTAYINTTGGPAMAKGGSGDVLAGMIASMIGQKFPIKDAVLASVFLHGLAGDMCAAELGEYSVTAGDITSMLPKAILSLQRRG